jgi:hypothetical protein
MRHLPYVIAAQYLAHTPTQLYPALGAGIMNGNFTATENRRADSGLGHKLVQ